MKYGRDGTILPIELPGMSTVLLNLAFLLVSFSCSFFSNLALLHLLLFPFTAKVLYLFRKCPRQILQ